MLLRWIAIYAFAILVAVLGVISSGLYSVSQDAKRELSAALKDAETAKAALDQHSSVTAAAHRSLNEMRQKLIEEGTARASLEAKIYELRRALDEERRARDDAEATRQKAELALGAERQKRLAAEDAQAKLQAENAKSDDFTLPPDLPADTVQAPSNDVTATYRPAGEAAAQAHSLAQEPAKQIAKKPDQPRKKSALRKPPATTGASTAGSDWPF